MNKIIVIAFGGNALIDNSGDISFSYQYEYLCRSIKYIADLKEQGWKILIVHGNGPQVGFSLRRSELAKSEIPELPLDYAVAESQGSIGFMFQKALNNEFLRRKSSANIISLVTQTLVDFQDPAFKHPTKPVGSFMSKEEAEVMSEKYHWNIMEDSGRGWRRVVASPRPIKVIETSIIRSLLEKDTIVIAAGGGGIAVSETNDRDIISLEAVIDKDLSASILAVDLQADYFLIPTGVEKVAVNFGKPNQEWLSSLDVKTAEKLIDNQEFGKGSMQPKIEAILAYLKKCPTGNGVITDPPSILKALAGLEGTRIHM